MTRTLRIVLIPALVAGLVLAASPAQASKQNPVITKSMISVSDLSSSYGKPSKIWANDLGKGIIPSACFNPADGSEKVTGKPDAATYYKEIDYAAGNTMWQDTIYMYSSAKKSRESYQQMLAGSQARCNSTYSVNISDDEATKIMATQDNETDVLPTVDEYLPRFAVSASTTLENQAQAVNGYKDMWVYTVVLRQGSVIHQISLVQDGPIQPVQVRDAQRAVVATARRFAALP